MPTKLKVHVVDNDGIPSDFDDAEFVSFINGKTFGIPGGETIAQKIRAGNKVLFLNTENIDYMTIEQDGRDA